MVFVGINLLPRASFLRQSDWLAFFSNQSLCIRKETLGTSLSVHALLLSFQTQQERTVLVWYKVGKAVARVQKNNIQPEVKYRKIRKVNLGVIYIYIAKQGWAYSRVLQCPLPNPQAVMFASQGDTHVRTGTEIKFLYYLLLTQMLCHKILQIIFQQKRNKVVSIILQVSVKNGTKTTSVVWWHFNMSRKLMCENASQLDN